ncbi:Serine/threonine-protein kinase HipA [compost metagenome]
MGVGAGDHKRFLQWVIFNLYVGNNDSHAKNLSVLQSPNGQYRLAPFYDLMCTAMYPGLSRRFAFSVGGVMTPGSIGREQIEAMATDLGFHARYGVTVARSLMTALPAALKAVQASLLAQSAVGSERTLIERLGNWIKTNARRHAQRWE